MTEEQAAKMISLLEELTKQMHMLTLVVQGSARIEVHLSEGPAGTGGVIR